MRCHSHNFSVFIILEISNIKLIVNWQGRTVKRLKKNHYPFKTSRIKNSMIIEQPPYQIYCLCCVTVTDIKWQEKTSCMYVIDLNRINAAMQTFCNCSRLMYFRRIGCTGFLCICSYILKTTFYLGLIKSFYTNKFIW